MLHENALAAFYHLIYPQSATGETDEAVRMNYAAYRWEVCSVKSSSDTVRLSYKSTYWFNWFKMKSNLLEIVDHQDMVVHMV